MSGRCEILDDLLRFHHNGLAVRKPDQAFCFLAMQGYSAGRSLYDPSQRVNLAMWHHPVGPDFEVIWPGPDPSPIDKIIKRHGSSIYHCCYETASFDRAIDSLESRGLEVIPVGVAKPAPLFDGRSVAFFIVDGFGLVEFLC